MTNDYSLNPRNFTTVRQSPYSCGLAGVKTYPLFINGEFVAPEAPATLDVLDPATAEVIARVPDASAADVDRAVKAARTAFDEGPWKDATAQDRGRILLELANIVRDRAAELAELETRNTGKPIVEAEFDITDVATCFEYYGGVATQSHRQRRGRQDHHAQRGEHAEEDLTGARRKIAEHLFRRRRLRARGRRRAVRRVLQSGRGLLGRQPYPRPAADLQEVCRRDGREGARDYGRAPDGSPHEDGRARQPRADRSRARV